jgi:hypothetical protein
MIGILGELPATVRYVDATFNFTSRLCIVVPEN